MLSRNYFPTINFLGYESSGEKLNITMLCSLNLMLRCGALAEQVL